MKDTLVLDLTRLLPGPLAGRILAEMGYRVLRLIPPQGDFMEQVAPETYEWLNAGKQTEVVDLKTAHGCQRLQTVVGEAAILLETNRPGVMERLGVGPDQLRAINPALTYVRIAGYRDAVFHEAPGHDLAYLAADGLFDRFAPAIEHLQLADNAGAFWAVLAAQQGMLQGGGFFEVYLAETARSFAYPPVPGLSGDRICYALYPTADGRIVLTAPEPHFWNRFCHLLDRPHWLSEAFSLANANNQTWNEVCLVFQSRSALDWEQWALEHGIPLRAVASVNIPETILPWSAV